jgi:nuclear pore complex protein Nup85
MHFTCLMCAVFVTQLHDFLVCSIWEQLKLLNWKDGPLLSVSETHLLLNKLQELSLAKQRPHFAEPNLPPQALSSIRLALATNLGRAILDE